MAGTPTTNYNIPTYADTDAPDLSGAYNDAMGIIDTQLKANSDATAAKQNKLTAGTGISIQGDTISATATGGTEYKGAAPINVAGDTISVATATPNEDGGAGQLGVVQVTSSETAITNTGSGDVQSPRVPNIYAVKKYVDSAMAAAGAAYTGTAPIVVDNGSHTISVTGAKGAKGSGDALTYGAPGTVSIAGNSTLLDEIADKAGESNVAFSTVPNCFAVKSYVARHTPDASTSVKGLVRLTNAYNGSDTSMAVTGAAIKDIYNNATTNVTVDMLKNLYCDPATGFVVYKPSE